MFIAQLRGVAALTMVLLLVGCQTLPDKSASDTQEWLRSQSYFKQAAYQHSQLSHWEFSGKVGIRSDTLSESANIIWKYADQSNNVRMFGPLGAGAIKLDFDRYGVQLSDSKGLVHRGNSAEQLLTQIVGWPIPIDALNFWLFGLPAPDSVYEYQLSDTGRLSQLKQMGWTISYSAYTDYPKINRNFARKVLAQKQVSGEQTLTVKIITKNWQW